MRATVGFLVPVLAMLSHPGGARADTLARSPGCGTALALEQSADGTVTLTGVQPTAIPLGTRTGTLTAGIESVPWAHGQILVATVRAGGDPALAAVLACGTGGGARVLWHGVTAWQGEDVGARTRDDVLVRTVAGRRTVTVGQRDESLALAPGLFPLVNSHRVDPATGDLVAATVDPLTEDTLTPATATPVVAEGGHGGPVRLPWAGVRVASDGVSGDQGRTLADGDPSTGVALPPGAWVLASVRADGLAVRGVDLVARTGSPLPRAWTVLTQPEGVRRAVTVTEAVLRTGRVFIPFGAGSRVGRVALVAGAGAPGAALGELVFRTELDDPGVDVTARLVSLAAQADGDDAAARLVAMGDPGVTALLAALPGMGVSAARRTLRLLGTVHAVGVAQALVAALARRETATAAMNALAAQGEGALAALSTAVVTDPRAAEAIALSRAPVAARVRAVEPALTADARVWQAARPAVAGVLHAAAASGGLDGWVEGLPAEPGPASRGLALAAREVTDPAAQEAVTAAARVRWEGATDFGARYRLLAALLWSAAGRDVLAQVATGHDDADLRAEAARVLGGVTGAQDVLGRVLHDRVPRVRAAAAAGLRPDDTHRAALETALRDDPWPTVRAAAARSLAGDAGAVPALLAALDQGSFTVVGAAMDALGQAPGTAPGVTARLLAFVGDHARNPDLRRAAADALGARCDPAAAVPLEQLAEAFSEPGLPPFEEEVGHTVMAALARTDPARARAFVTRNGSNAAAAAAVEAAIRGGCAAGAGSR